LNKQRLAYSSVQVHGTPRRLTVLVQDLAPAQTPQQSKVPPAAAALVDSAECSIMEIVTCWLVHTCDSTATHQRTQPLQPLQQNRNI
jgi:glycyl-tRNA synthetase beta subunit